jgi:radical SAM superfamily enzyme YgiQ (UPF0313 family)
MAKDIWLINPPYPSEMRDAAPPLGIASIASYLEKNGYKNKIEIIDGFLLEKKHGYDKSLKIIKEKIKKERPLILGCSVLYTNEKEAYEIIKVANEVGSYSIVGNYMAIDTYRSNSKVTAIVRGEGEITTKELIDNILSGKGLYDIKGVTFRDRNKIVENPDRALADLNELPPPAFHLIPSIKDYDYLSIEESRGCCFSCSFCSIKELYTSYRLKSSGRIRAEVENISKLGMNRIDVIGELVLLEGKRAIEIGDAMREFGCDWKINAHPTLVVKRKDILPLLSKRRLKIIETAVESGCQHSLDVFNKQTTPELNEEAIETAIKTDILPFIDFINFHPYLTMDDLRENIRFVMRHLPLFTKAPYYPEDNIFKPWIPVPRTPLFDRASEDNLIKRGDDKDSFIWMKYAPYTFTFIDKEVEGVVDLIDYFLKGYGKRYHRLLQPIIDEGAIFIESPKVSALAILPAFILCMSYALVKSKIPGEEIIDWYCQQRFVAIEQGRYDVELPATPFYKEKIEIMFGVIKELVS